MKWNLWALFIMITEVKGIYYTVQIQKFLKEYKVQVQSFSHIRIFATPRTAVRPASLSITNSLSLLKLMSTDSVMLSTI